MRNEVKQCHLNAQAFEEMAPSVPVMTFRATIPLVLMWSKAVLGDASLKQLIDLCQLAR